MVKMSIKMNTVLLVALFCGTVLAHDQVYDVDKRLDCGMIRKFDQMYEPF